MTQHVDMVASAGTGSKRPTASIAALMAALLLAIFACQLNISMIAPALVTMQAELAASAADIALTQTIFFTAGALFSLFLPRLGDLVGRKKVLIGMLAGAVIGCIISGLAVNVAMLMVGRILQGAIGGTIPLCLIMLHVRVTDDKTYARLMAILTAINGGIAGVDALAGGWLAQHWGFRSLFWVMMVVSVIAILLVVFLADESTARDTPRMDWVGVILLVVALGALLTAANAMQGSFGDLGIPNPVFALILVVVAAAAFAGFWQVEKRGTHPMITTTYLKQRRTWGLLLTTVLTMTGVFAVMNGIVPALGQDPNFGLGLSAEMVSWVTLTPYALAGLVFGPICGLLASKFGFLRMLRFGLISTVVGLVLTLVGALNPSIALMLLISVVVGITYAGIANIMLNGLGIVLSPEDNPGYLPGLNGGAFNLGAGISFIVLYAVPGLFGSTVGGGQIGYVSGIVAGLVIVVLAFAASFLIPDPRSLAAGAGSDTPAGA